MIRPWLRGAALGLLSVLAASAPAQAQNLGTFRFQLVPFDETVTFTVVDQGGGVATLSGFVEVEGVRSAAFGTGFLRPDGKIGLGFTAVFNGAAFGTDVELDLATLTGTWRDDAGNAGTFEPR